MLVGIMAGVVPVFAEEPSVPALFQMPRAGGRVWCLLWHVLPFSSGFQELWICLPAFSQVYTFLKSHLSLVQMPLKSRFCIKY